MQPPKAPRGLRLRVASPLLLVGCGALACGEPAATPPPDLGMAYEGTNFYESGREQPATVASNAPGFFEFFGEPETLPACNVGPTERASATPDDPSLVCPPLASDMISDFTFGGNPNGVTLGFDAALSGGTYHYPDGPDALRSDVTEGDWHITGTVAAISGFGIYLDACRLFDAAAYRGISFSLWGEIGEGGSLVFFVGTAENEVSSAWLSENDPSANEPPNLGRCIPLGSRYDGTCREARVSLAIPEAPTSTRVLWRDFTDGCPETTVNPSEITALAWYFPPAPDGRPYSVDIHIDDLRFSDEGPL